MAVSQEVSEHEVDVAEKPPDVCGYVHDLSTVEGVGASACYRETFEDEDRCVWHVDDENTPDEYFEEQVPEPGERLDGAFVPAVKIVEEDWFERCTLIGSTFDSTVLRRSSFVGTDLREATFRNVDARGTVFTDADLRGVSFDSVDFRDATFGNTRFAQAVLTNARINRETDFGDHLHAERAIDDADSREEFRHQAESATWTYRMIHSLYVDNAMPLEAREYYYREKNMRRRLAWGLGNYSQAIKAEGARWVTGYGMNPYRVIGTAVLVMLVSAFLFPLTGGIEETSGEEAVIWSLQSLGLSLDYMVYVYLKSIYFSIITFTTLGYGDIRPVGNAARAIAGIESLLGALLTALLVFVLSRRIS